MNYYFLLSVAFLLVMVVGLFLYLWYAKGIRQFQDYIAINRSIGTAPLVIALITITISGSFLQVSIGSVSIYGISASIIRALSYSIVPLFFAYAIFPRLLRLQNIHSLGGVIQHMYGSWCYHQLCSFYYMLFPSLPSIDQIDPYFPSI